VTVPSSNLGPAIALIALAAASLPANAASNDAAQRCARIGDDGARLACYDGIFRSPSAGSTSGTTAPGSSVAAPAAAAAAAAPATVAAGPVPAAAMNPTADFGLSEAAKRAQDPEKAKQLSPDSISARVASVGHRPTGELVVTLDNGQVWAQLETDTQARVSGGDTVTIKKAALGSYVLVPPNKVAMRVRRIK
jgi:hypothetical protein